MAEQVRSIDINDVPALARLAQEVRATGESRVLRQEQDDVAVVIRMEPKRRKRAARIPRGKAFTKGDSLFNIIGIADDPTDPVTDVAANKHKYLAEDYLAKHR